MSRSASNAKAGGDEWAYSEGQYFDHLFYGLTVEEFAANSPHVPLGAEWVRQARYTGSAQGEG
jgi:hypothetical protein